MAQSIKTPPMGESISEATVASWRVKPGDSFNAGDILVELETDKVTMEVPAPSSGTLKEIKRNSGDTVKVDETLGEYEEGPGRAASPPPAAAASAAAPAAASPAAPAAAGPRNETLPPGARRLAAEAGVNPADVAGSGKRGQVTKPDVVNYIEQRAAAPSAPARSAAARGERESVVAMSRLRQKIAERLVEAQHTAAILTTFNEVDMHAVMELRARYKDAFKEKHQVGLGFMSFFVRAAVLALQETPAVNAEIRGTDLIYKNYYDIGVAVGGPKGLVVPVVRDADQLSLAGIEQEILRLALRVKEGSIALEELQGGTFTISNGGIYGSMMSTPILNPPQVGILGMHNIVKRPMVVNDQIVIRPMMYLALSYDHRVIDGKEAVTFLVRIKQLIEDPQRMLLDI
ncbi:MAG: 2-oxoglutarate dehydrogenase complex dihydrolipoyllysine-residue succinyltransferase [Leptospirales bacterium]|nr:2-oxoglutarate dehydrogenase complex dihydrolipoyllysine-residue succinyltransferase [Leptospirales bacterium]